MKTRGALKGHWRNRIVGHGDADPASLKAHPRNWRTHPKAQLDALAGAMDEVGVVQNVIVNKRTGHVLDGHARRELAIARGEPTIPVVYVDLSVDEEALVLASLDPLAGLAGVDQAKLDDLLAEISVNDEALGAFLSGLSTRRKPERADPDAVPAAPATQVTHPGDLWILGDHRLLCGDATNAADYRRLLQGAAAQLVFTDPPYGVSYASAHAPIKNDNRRRDELSSFLSLAFVQIAEAMAENAAAYVWHASATREDYAWALKAAGLQELQYIIWAKPALVLGWADYQWQHEPCFYACKDGHHPEFFGERTETTVWTATLGPAAERALVLGAGVLVSDGGGHEIFITDKAPRNRKVRSVRLAAGERLGLIRNSATSDLWEVARDVGTAEHPTQKPVELAERAIVNSSRAGEAVLDPFLGSGTTLIAAERQGRRCYAMEIEPRYVDVAVRRWEEYTGKKATRDGEDRAEAATDRAPRRTRQSRQAAAPEKRTRAAARTARASRPSKR